MPYNKLFLMFVLLTIIIPYIQSDSQTHSLESTLQLVKLKNGDVLFGTIIEKDSASILLTTYNIFQENGSNTDCGYKHNRPGKE